jgi:anti-anti-sigma regulatory factor
MIRMSFDPCVFRFSDLDVLVAPPRCGLVAIPDLIRSIDNRSKELDAPYLVLDLSEVVAWETSVLSSMAWARRRCVAAGGDLALVLPRHRVFTANEVALLKQLFLVAEDVHTAKETLERLAEDPPPLPRAEQTLTRGRA